MERNDELKDWTTNVFAGVGRGHRDRDERLRVW